MSRPRTRTSKARRWIEACLLLAGVIGVGVWGWSHVRMAVFQSWGNHELDHRTQRLPPAMPAPGASAPPPIQNGALIGRLAIPRLKMRAVVREGAGQDTLDVALGHIPGTSLPGQPGNSGIAGHRDTLFRGLRKIAKDDLIEFQTPSGSYNYKVESTGIVKPDDVAVLHAGHYPEITLVTCYPFYYVGSAPDRFIVKARLVDPPAAPAPAPTPPTPAATASAPSHDRILPSHDQPSHDSTLPSHDQPSHDRKGAVSPAIQKVNFRVTTLHSRQLAPGIMLRLTWTDARRHRANGWLWMPREQRTIWLWNQPAHQPVSFRVPAGGPRRELTITSVTRDSVTGYLSSTSGF